MLNSALVIGYGSMGRRHARILKNKIKVKEITICTRQKINRFSTLRNLSDLKTIPFSFDNSGSEIVFNQINTIMT